MHGNTDHTEPPRTATGLGAEPDRAPDWGPGGHSRL